MTVSLRIAVLLVVLPALAAAMPARADQPAAGTDSASEPDKKGPEKPRVAVTISKQTTRITRPLRKDGYVNYVAALNERASQGVTPENNAAVLIWKAVGPGEIVEEAREQFFEMLGTPPLPETGDYYVALEEYSRRAEAAEKPGTIRPDDERLQQIRDRLDEAMLRPWSKKEFPTLAGWLAANEGPLAMVVEASKRPRRYDPLIAGEEGMVIAVSLPGIQQHRQVARALVARAMLRLGENKVDQAWADLLACHRLARLSGQGPTLIDALVGIAIDGIACRTDQALLQHVRLTAARAGKMRDDLRKLAPMPKMIKKIDVSERFMYLDGAAVVARDGLDRLSSLGGTGGETGGVTKTLTNWAARATIDWDTVLRMGNSWYDRMVDAFGKPTRAERKEALAKIDDDILKMTQEARDLKSLAASFLGGPGKAISRWTGQVLLTLFLPAVAVTADAEDRAAMQSEVNSLGFALAAYRAGHDSYPVKLSGLVPEYVAEVPKDIFSAEPLHYERQHDGYLLYSVGVNGIDDGGLTYGDRKEAEDWDDLAVRVPAANR